MTQGESNALLELTRVIDRKIDFLQHTMAAHIEKDEEFYKLVAKHDRIVGYSVKGVKWASGVLVAALLGYLGLK